MKTLFHQCLLPIVPRNCKPELNVFRESLTMLVVVVMMTMNCNQGVENCWFEANRTDFDVLKCYRMAVDSKVVETQYHLMTMKQDC